MASMLIDCAHCRTPLVLPPGAPSIVCAVCHCITHVAHAAPPHPAWSPPPYQHRDPDLGLSDPQRYGPTWPNAHYPGLDLSNPQRYAPAPPNVHGSKRAVIIGVSYKYSRYELRGCLNDANCMKYMLTTKFHFPEQSILLLTEDQKDPFRKPTKSNIKMAMLWLVQGLQAGDSLFFHFSGHGSQQRNDSGDEVDGFDETILPMDFETEGMIVDDEINEAIVRPLPHGVQLHAVVDACHSGTVLDLSYLCRKNRKGHYIWEDHQPLSGAWKGTNGGEAFCFSGCDDDQTSADTDALSQVTFTGAMTFSFIQAIERGHAKTYKDLLSAMRDGVESANGKSGDSTTSLVQMLLTGGSYTPDHIQEPQLTAAKKFDIDKPFSL